MYGKFFDTTFTGSMMAAGADVFAVWGYVIANTIQSHVELNPRLLAAVIGSTPERMQQAVDYLCAPDAQSRNDAHEGRRLVPDGQYQFFVPSHERYRSIMNADDRREYNRVKKRESRERKSSVKPSVNDIS